MLFFARKTRKALRMLTLLGSLVLTFLYLFHYLSFREKHNLDNVRYVVLILGGPDTLDQRQTARDTWFNFARNIYFVNNTPNYEWRLNLSIDDLESNMYKGSIVQPSQATSHKDLKSEHFVRFFFTIGTKNLNMAQQMKLHFENVKYKDLLLLDNIEDKYENLTPKMLQSIVWISDNLKDVEYLVKCDLDAFVRIDLIIKELGVNGVQVDSLRHVTTYKDHSPNPRGIYWGYFIGNSEVKNDGKWKEENWFLCDLYLPYTFGSGYVISRSVVNYIAKNSALLSQYFCEDVSMGVWTSALNIRRIHDLRFETDHGSPRRCDKHVLVSHTQSSGDVYELYNNLLFSRGEKLCAFEYVKTSYLYVWSNKPKLCCDNIFW